MMLMISALASVLLLTGCGRGLSGQATGEDVEDIEMIKQEVSAISSGLAELIGQIEQIEEAIEVLDASASDLARSEAIEALDASASDLARSEAIEALDTSVSDLARSVERVLAETHEQRPPGATGSTSEKPNGSPGPTNTPAPPGQRPTSSALLDWHLHREEADDGDIEVSESGSTYAFDLWLWSQPSSDAVLSIVSDDTGEMTVSPGTLTFTSSNWDTAQTVTVTGVDDTEDDGDQTTMVTVSGVGDGWLDDGEIVAVITEDDDKILPNSLSVVVDSTSNWGGWANGTYTRCTGTPCGHLDVQTWNGREVYVKPGANSTDPNDGWYYAYIFARPGGQTWPIQYVKPDGQWNAHSYCDGSDPWTCDWPDSTVTAVY
jgi:hypothetical protein